jgi:hypothetical protein
MEPKSKRLALRCLLFGLPFVLLIVLARVFSFFASSVDDDLNLEAKKIASSINERLISGVEPNRAFAVGGMKGGVRIIVKGDLNEFVVVLPGLLKNLTSKYPIELYIDTNSTNRFVNPINGLTNVAYVNRLPYLHWRTGVEAIGIVVTCESVASVAHIPPPSATPDQPSR